MLTLWKSVAAPILEYCIQVWCPCNVGDIQRIEAVQRSFTSTIAAVKHLGYWARLKALELYSLERRRERYIVIYTWKMLEGLVPNIGVDSKNHLRLGRICKVPYANNRARAQVRTLKNMFLTVRGPILFNALPIKIRSVTGVSVDSFKNQLDKFLKELPDDPATPGYHRRAISNTIADQAALRRRDGWSRWRLLLQNRAMLPASPVRQATNSTPRGSETVADYSPAGGSAPNSAPVRSSEMC